MATAIGTYATLANVKIRLKRNDAAEDTFLQALCDSANAWIEMKAQRVLAPIASATYTFDSSAWSDYGRLLVFRNGIRAVTSLKIAGGTGQTLQTIPSTEYVLRPLDLPTAWPYTSLYIHNANGTAPFSSVPNGYGVAEMTATSGFAAIPDEIRELAEVMVARAFAGRASGQSDILGTDETGAPVVSRYLSSKDRETLEYYRYRPGGGVLTTARS